MSIETERWRYDAEGNCIRDANGEGVNGYVDSRTMEAIAVLPEALALLKRLDRRGGLGLEEHEAIQDVLRRAGVLA